MANPIQLKRSKTAGNTPASLADGEVAVNIPDRKLYVNDGMGTIRNVDLLSDLEKSQVANVIGGGVGLTVISQGADQTGTADSTTAFSNAAASTAPHPVRLSPGTYRLAAGTYLGAKCIVADVGSALRNSSGAASDAYISGGLQIAAELDAVAATAPGSLVTPFSRARFVSGQIAGTAGSGKAVAALDKNTLFYNGVVANAYDAPAIVDYNYIVYGSSTPATGCAALLNGAIFTYGVAQASQGRTELTPISVGLVCDPSSNQYKTNLYYDFVISGPITQQESYIGGLTMHTQKRNSGTTLDTDHSGAYGSVVSTSANGAGFGTPGIANTTTYPLIAMHAVSGFTGPAGTSDGAASGATAAAQYGYITGGGRSVWLNPFATSAFQYGMGLGDWGFGGGAGLIIRNRHPSGSGPGIDSAYEVKAPQFTVDSLFYSAIVGGNPAFAMDTNTFFYYDRAAKNYAFNINGAVKAVISASAVAPGQDNTLSLGTAQLRFTTVYAATGTINTSDAERKTGFREADKPLLLAALDTPLVMFQWKDAVAEKGADNARWHFGPTAQSFRDACLARGFDPKGFGGYCEDPEVIVQIKTRTVSKPVEEEYDLDPEEETFIDESGAARVRTVTRKGVRPKMRAVPVLDDQGKPIIRSGTMRVPDGETEVEVPTPEGTQIEKRMKYREETVESPVIHYEPETEQVEETYEEEVSTGGTVHGLRLDQFDRLLNHARWLVSTGQLTWAPLSKASSAKP